MYSMADRAYYDTFVVTYYGYNYKHFLQVNCA